MATYSTQLFAGTLPANGTTVYTATASSTTIIRDIELYNFSAGQLSGGVNVAASGGSLKAVLHPNTPLASGESWQWQGRVVLVTGDVISSGAGGSPLICCISGYELSP